VNLRWSASPLLQVQQEPQHFPDQAENNKS
jgi:hypothetical protein